MSRTGHTLIEILLALGLSLVILTAVYAALDQHWRYAEAGQRQTERMQVTRALFERISLDLRSVVFRPSAGPEHAIGLVDTRIDVAQPDEAYGGRSIGVVGDGETLVVQTSTPNVEGSSGSQTVRWEVRAVESRTAANQTGETNGLARIARDKATIVSSDAAQAVSTRDLLAAEVETIRFRYFAGGSWLDRWDSVVRQKLPRAVEITIGFRKLNSVDQRVNDKEASGEYRLIVPVPASEA
jgi:Tfp pilus assembly protein PilW